MSEHIIPEEFDMAIIDGDALVYKAAIAAERTIYILKDENDNVLGEFESARAVDLYKYDQETMLEMKVDDWVRSSEKRLQPLKTAHRVLDHLIQKIKSDVKAKEYKHFIGGKDNFRKDVATIAEYKGQRTEKPHYFQDVREYYVRKYGAKIINGIEADDAVSVNLANDPENRILCYIDKDLKNTFSWHYHLDKYTIEYITPEDADYNFAMQMLTGDTTDCITGLPNIGDDFREKYKLPKRSGVGKATAKAILTDVKGKSLQELYNRVLEAYQSYYSDPYTYTSWDGKELTRTPEEILDENCTLLFMMRKKGEKWMGYKTRTFE